MNLKNIIRAVGIGIIGTLLIWIFSGSSASIGFGLLLFYFELRK